MGRVEFLGVRQWESEGEQRKGEGAAGMLMAYHSKRGLEEHRFRISCVYQQKLLEYADYK